MKEIFKVKDAGVYKLLLDELFYMEMPYQVEIGPIKNKRSLDQNALMWHWHQQYSDRHGVTKDRAHMEFKYIHVRPILCRDDEGYRELYEAVGEAQIEALTRLVSTSDLSVEQFSEALSEYDMRQASKGLLFSKDRYYEEAFR